MKGKEKLIIFDMDGVLVDATDSYRRTIIETVHCFSGRMISNGEIQEMKNRGGFNDDWKLSFELIKKRGRTPSFQDVVCKFNEFYLGKNGSPGFCEQERWLPEEKLWSQLDKKNYVFSIFTGREREDLARTLKKFAPQTVFDPLITMESVKHQKPHPEGLLKIQEINLRKELIYVGDNVDDASAANEAKVRFIGVAGQRVPDRQKLIELFEQENSWKVIDDVNQLLTVL